MKLNAQVIFMQESTKIFSLILLAIFILSALVFLGMGQFENQLASLAGVVTAWVTINPLEVNVSAPFEVKIDRVFQITAEIVNQGEEKIEKVKGEIFLPQGLILFKKEAVQEIGVISGKKKKRIYWLVKGQEAGTFIILVSASGELKGKLISDEDTVKVEVREFSKASSPLEWLQNLTDSFRTWLNF